MNPPSLDPPPDQDYPGFIDANKDRRSIIFVGANDGMIHAFDGRTGVEVWAFIPFNLLPKLKTLREGEPVSFFQYFVDSSPKISDVKIGGLWRTYMMFGEGLGGTFYQTLDVTLAVDGSSPLPTIDDVPTLLAYFSDPNRIPYVWSFPNYSHFDPTAQSVFISAPRYLHDRGMVIGCGSPAGCQTLQNFDFPIYGELSQAMGATATEMTVGYTWSDPAVGQVANENSPFVALTGSGFYPGIMEATNRGGAHVGRSLYMLKMSDGSVLGTSDVGSDGIGEAPVIDDCTVGAYSVFASSCTNLKNSLQADVLTAGQGGDKFMGKVLAGDLDGNVWAWSLTLDQSNTPQLGPPSNRTAQPALPWTNGQAAPSKLPIFNGLSIVPFQGWTMYIMWAQGSDKLPTWCMGGIGDNAHVCGYNANLSTGTTAYGVVSWYDPNTAGQSSYFAKYLFARQQTNEEGERPIGAPAVAGYVIFVATNVNVTSQNCGQFNASLYAFSMQATAAYDTNRNGALDNNESPVIKTFNGQRTTGAFTIDRHVAFGVGGNVELFGDPQGFDNAVGAAGIRFLSWREVR